MLEVLDDVQEQHCIDLARVYAAGCSNGGMFTFELASDPRSAPRIAAIAPQHQFDDRGSFVDLTDVMQFRFRRMRRFGLRNACAALLGGAAARAGRYRRLCVPDAAGTRAYAGGPGRPGGVGFPPGKTKKKFPPPGSPRRGAPRGGGPLWGG